MPRLFRILLLLLIAAQSHAVMVQVWVGNGNMFSPSSFTIQTGDTVKWVWASGFHNTSGVTVPIGATAWYSNITSIDTTFLYVPDVSGLYTYTCTYHSGMNGQFFVTGCSYPDKPVITSAGSAVACEGDTVLLSVPMLAGLSYQWIQGPTAIPQATSHTLPVTATGNYKVLVNRCGVDSVSDPFPVTIHPRPAATFTYTNTGLSFTFSSTYTSPETHTFLWTFDDGSPAQTTLLAYRTFSAAGNYRVSLMVTDTGTGCSDTFSSFITVNTVGITPLDLRSPEVFPNPASSVIHIRHFAEATILLMNPYGQQVARGKTDQNGRYDMDVRHLPAGLYYLKTDTDQGRNVSRITLVR